ncbi:iron-sulfur cluster assembly scaffold protein [Candidatus Mycoplasma pogonae]
MSLSNDNNQKRALIMKHYLSGINRVGQVEQWKNTNVYSQNCVDNLELAIKIENNKIIDAKFSGDGCAVFLASTDIFLENIKNKSLNQVEKILINYENLINQKPTDVINLNNLVIFNNVKTHLNRLECASIIIKATKKILSEN